MFRFIWAWLQALFGYVKLWLPEAHDSAWLGAAPAMEEEPVTVSLGPIGPLFQQLRSVIAALQGNSRRLKLKGIKAQIQILGQELEGLCIDLKGRSEEPEDAITRCWMRQIRDLCYDTADYLDELGHFIHCSSGTRRRRTRARTFGGNRLVGSKTFRISGKLTWLSLPKVKKLKRAPLIAKLSALVARIEDADEARKRFKLSPPTYSKPDYGQAAVVMPQITKPQLDIDKLNKLLDLDGNEMEKNLKVVTIFGSAGVGKTPIARTLYHQHRGRFQHRAFIGVSRDPDMRRLLTDMLSQIKAPPPHAFSDVQGLIGHINKHLQAKRYLIIIDDLWSTSTWDIIIRALPAGDYCRIITTTQVEDVALACCSYQLEHIYAISPLNDDQSGKSEGGCPTYPSSEGMKEALNHVYNNLPPRLKTCLLYLNMYPEGYTVRKDELVKQWVAEGFISSVQGQDIEDTAGCYFDVLVSSGLVQSVDTNHNGEVLSCTLHHMVLDLIRQKSMEENFVTIVNYFQTILGLPDKVRRLSVQLGGAKGANNIPENMRISQVRSLLFSGYFKHVPSIVDYGLLQVLILHIWSDQDTIFYLTTIGELYRLRYLKIESNMTVKLPGKIRRLQHLGTLQVDATLCAVPSDIVHLEKLLHLRLPSESNLPHRVGRMTSLRTLGYFDLGTNSEDNVRGLDELKNLQDLQLTCATGEPAESLEKNMQLLLGSVLQKLSTLRSVTLAPASGSCKGNTLPDYGAVSSMSISCDGFSSVSPAPAHHLQRLELSRHCCVFSRLPKWLGELAQLCIVKIAVRELTKEDIDILKGLPALAALSLHVASAAAEMIVFGKGGFSVLTYFKFTCTVPWLKFEADAMPNLQKLRLGFNATIVDRQGIIIEHLPEIKEITAIIGYVGVGVGSAWPKAITNDARNPKVQLMGSIYCGHEGREMVTPENSGEDEKNEAHRRIHKLPEPSHPPVPVHLRENVLDEVNLMVVYEPANSQENCKSREAISRPVEEVHEVRKSKIAEFASGKGKLVNNEYAEASLVGYKGINSSTRGHCIERTEHRKFYPPQSFSCHYPTNITYLGKGSRAVDVSRGAMGSLLDKLGKLVKEDYNMERSMKREIESFSEDLGKIHKDLPNLKNLEGAKIWVDEVRELSYNIEDMVDSFLVHVEPNSGRSGFRELPHEGLKFLENDMMNNRQIGDVIREIKSQVQVVVDRQKKYTFDVSNVIANATARAPIQPQKAIYINKEHLIGIEEKTNELIRLFEEDGNVSKQELKIVSIVGFGGLGKTTLAKAVYDKLKAQYHARAFVPVGRNPNVQKVLMNILNALGNINASNLDLEVWQLMDELKELLADKRYFIVIDDIWDSEAWGLIASAFPRNNHGSRVITTTRIEHVAHACCEGESKYVYRIKPLSAEDSRKLFLRGIMDPRKDFPNTPRKEQIFVDILKKCNGLPLALKSIASILASKEVSNWEHVRKSLGAMTEGDDLEEMKQILDLSYINLPDHLKTCLLYACMYPEDREIDKNDLLRQWVAEGFVNTNGRLDAVDVAEKYFKELISTSMIQPCKMDYNGEVLSCRVVDIILDLMRSKSSRENFIHVIDGSKDQAGQIRRVSFHCNEENDMRILETINRESLSHVRSAFLSQGSLVACFLEFKYVRVLHIEHKVSSLGLDLTGITRLFLLRYLKVACFPRSEYELKLPDQIGDLQQLETIDLDGCILKNYPSDIINLPWLSHLTYGGGGIVLPDGVDRLKSLRTLGGVCVYGSSVDSIKGLGKLTNLRKLQICSRESSQSEVATTMCMDALHSSIYKLSTNLRVLTFGEGSTTILDVAGWVSRTPFPRHSRIGELDLSCCDFERCPGWISQLHNLYKLTIMVREVADGFSIVAGLPSLAYFKLYIDIGKEEEKEESVVISGGGTFQALKHLSFRCKKASLIFEAEAMPKLEKLDMSFRYHMARQFLPIGIQHLPARTLKEISLSVALNDIDVEGSQYWDDQERSDYYSSDEYRDGVRQHRKAVWSMLKRAFKQHRSSADIVIQFEGDDIQFESDDDNEDKSGTPGPSSRARPRKYRRRHRLRLGRASRC